MVAVGGHPELYDNASTCAYWAKKQRVRRRVSKDVGLPGKLSKYVSAQHRPDRSKLYSGNKHSKSCLLVIWLTDSFIQGGIDVVISFDLLNVKSQ